MWSSERDFDIKENTETPSTPSHGKWYGPWTPKKERKAGSPRESPRLSLTMFAKTPRISFGKVKIGNSKMKRIIIDNPLSIAQSLHLNKWPESKGFTIFKPVEHGAVINNYETLDHTVEFIIPGMTELDLPIRWTPNSEGNYREVVTLNLGDFNRLNVILFGNAIDTAVKSKPKMKTMLPDHVRKSASSHKRKISNADTQSTSGVASKRILGESNAGEPEPKRPQASNENVATTTSVKPIVKSQYKSATGKSLNTSRKFKTKVAAKGIAPSRLNLTKHLTTERSLPRHPLPYAAKNMYYDEKWMEKQERGFLKWLNFILTPPDELAEQSVSEAEMSMCVFPGDNDSIQASQHLAPTKEVLSLRTYTARRKMARLRRCACLLYQSAPVAMVTKTIESEVEKNRLMIRADRHLHQDLGIKETVVKMLLSYNTLWLRIGLETIYGEVLPLQSNNDVTGLRRFLKRRFLANPDIAKEYRHTTVAECYRPGYYEALKRFTLKKFLLLILFLDKAKLTRLIDHDPCLFNKNAEYKSSRLLLLSFSRDYLKGEGDVTKHLSLLNYTVTHEQLPLDEMDYAVTNLAVDLRDGLRITRVIELLTQNWRLSDSLRVPAISRLQKIHNVDVALNVLIEQGLLTREVSSVNPRHIVDGHREKTLSLLWLIILHFQVNQVVNEQQIRDEIVFLRRYHSQKNPHIAKHAITEHNDDVYGKSEKLGLLLEWCRSVCRLFGVKVDNFTVSMSDGRVMCYLLHFYHPSLLREEDICQDTTLTCNPYTAEEDSLNDSLKEDSLAGEETQDESSARLQQLKNNERSNHELLRDKVKELGGVPSMLRFADLSCTIPDEKVIITYLSYLCARLLDLRLESRAAMIIQLAWRRHREGNVAKELRRKNEAAVIIQRSVRVFLQKKRKKLIIRSTILIQAYARGYQARQKLNGQNRAAAVVQSYYRSFRLAKKTRREFVQLKQTVLQMQAHYRGMIARRHVRRNKAARLIQSQWRGCQARRRFLARKRSTILIQALVRKFMVKRRYQKLRTASVVIQRQYRAILLARKTRREFMKFKKVVTCLQARYRGKMARNQFKKLRAAILIQKFAKMWYLRRDFVKKKTAITKLQAIVRRNIAQKRYERLVCAAVVIQRKFRAFAQGLKARKAYNKLKASAVVIQSFYRQYVHRKQYLSTRRAVIFIQACARGFLVRKMMERQRNACLVVQTYFRGYLLMKKAAAHYKYVQKAVITLQAFWRGKATRLQFQRQKSVITAVQARIRGRQARQRYLRKKSAAIVLQVRYQALKHMHAQRVAYLETRVAIVALQSVVRGHLLRQKIKGMTAAATRIQTAYRRHSMRARYLQVQQCTLIIQRNYRARSLGRQAVAEYRRIRDAVVVIQKYTRGHSVRMEVHRMTQAAVIIQASYKQYREQKRYLTLREAARNIQLRLRATRKGQAVRQEYLLKRASVIRLQSALRSAVCVKQYGRQRQAVRIIQTRWRAVLWCREARERYHRIRGSVITIQAFARGLKARRDVERTRAAIKIQAWWKGTTQRQTFRMTRNAITTLQATFRMFVAKRRYEQLRSTVLYLQRLVRANQLCRHHTSVYQTTRDAIITLQAAVRGYRVRKELTIKNQAATRIQVAFKAFSTRRSYLKILSSIVVLQRRRRATIVSREAKVEYQRLRKSTIILQSHVRRLIAEKNFKESRRNIILLQSVIRSYQAKNSYSKKREAALFIQARYRAYAQGSAVRKLYHLQRGACITIQACVREWIERRKYLKLCKASKVIQCYYRATVCSRKQRQEYLKLRRAVVTIQAFRRGWIIRREMKRYHAATIIQSHWRMRVVRAWYRHQRQCVIQIQSFIRMWSSRRQYTAIHEAAVVIQRRFRANQLCKQERNLFMEMKGSCFLIQHCYRFYRQRRLVKKMLETVSTLRDASLTLQHRFRANQLGKSTRIEYLLLRRSAILIQAAYRGHRARVHVVRCRAAIVIQSSYRGYRQRSEYKSLKRATIKLQALARGKQTYHEYRELRAAAVTIQRLQRANLHRNSQREIFLTQKNSAIVIQSFFRGYTTRKCYQELRRNIIKIQSLVRRKLAIKAYLKLLSAAIVIQRRERARVLGIAQRNSFLTLKKCTVLLQSRFRGKRVRTRFVEKRNATVKLQALARGKRARKTYEMTRNAVIVIQRRERARVLGIRTRERYLQYIRRIVLIQSLARSRQEKAWYLELRRAVITMQACVRGKIERKRYKELRAAAIVLQVRERARVHGKRTREEYLTKRRSAILIQSYARSMQQRTRYLDLRRAAIVVQTHVRRKHARDTYKKTRAAAIVIQRRERAILKRKQQRQAFLRLRNSAILIQSAARCYQERTRYLELKHAVIMVQAHVRGNRARDSYQKLRQAVTVVQRQYRAHKLGQEVRQRYQEMKQAVVAINIWYCACVKSQRIRAQFLLMRTAVIKLQACYRGHVVRQHFKREKAARIIQAYARGSRARLLAKRLQAEKSARLFRFSAAVFVNLMAVRLQRAYRKARAIAAFKAKMDRLVFLQQWWRAKLQRLSYLRMRDLVRLVQRKWRERLIVKNQSATRIQARVRTFLAKRTAEKRKEAILVIQCAWRGYAVRKRYNATKFKKARRRILLANSNVTEPMKLCNRTRSALDYLLKCKNLTTIREALVHLEVGSRLSHKCTVQLVMDNALGVIFKVVRDSNRSLAHMGLIKLALDIFINVSKCPSTNDAVVRTERNSLDTLVELACIFRENYEIFLKVTNLLTILCGNEEIRKSLLSMTKAVNKIKSIHALTKRKYDFEMKRNTAKAKARGTTKKLDDHLPVNPLLAIRTLTETLGLDN